MLHTIYLSTLFISGFTILNSYFLLPRLSYFTISLCESLILQYKLFLGFFP